MRCCPFEQNHGEIHSTPSHPRHPERSALCARSRMGLTDGIAKRHAGRSLRKCTNRGSGHRRAGVYSRRVTHPFKFAITLSLPQSRLCRAGSLVRGSQDGAPSICNMKRDDVGIVPCENAVRGAPLRKPYRLFTIFSVVTRGGLWYDKYIYAKSRCEERMT